MGFFDIFKRKTKKQNKIVELSQEDLKWNKMWELWVDGEIELPYKELIEYYTGINNGGHHCHLDNVYNNSDLKEYVEQLKRLDVDFVAYQDEVGVKKTTEEKIAELEHIAYNLGAKSFSVEIVETDYSNNTKNLSINANVSLGGGISSSKGRMQSGKNTTFFGGGKSPEMPTLKWFAHDDNIKRLVQMRLENSNSVQSKVLEIRGSSTVTMSKSIAGAIDDLCGIKGGISMINETIKQYNSILIFEIEHTIRGRKYTEKLKEYQNGGKNNE